MIEDQANFLESLIALLEEHRIRYCLADGVTVNAYAAPVVTEDLDLAVAVDQLEQAEALLRGRFKVERFAYTLNVVTPGSNLRVQIRTDPCYFDFVDRASRRGILGLTLPVAAVEDVLQGKVWAVLETQRRASKRQKDLADISRLLEAFPQLRDRVPAEVLARLFT